MKKLKLRVVAGVMALLLMLASVGNIAVIGAEGTELTVTSEMADANGTITIPGGDWDKIVVDRTVDAEKIVLNNVVAKELVVESGSKCLLEVFGGNITTLNVMPPQLEIIGYEEIKKMLADGMDANEVIDLYSKNQKERTRLESLRPTLVTGGTAMIENLQVSGSVALNISATQVGKVKISGDGTQNNVQISIKGYDGAVSVEQKDTEQTVFSLLNIQLEDSNLSSFDLSGEGKSVCLLEGDKKSNIKDMNVFGAGDVTMNVAADSVRVDKKAENASVKLYSTVKNVVVEGDNNSLRLASNAKVNNAVIEGDNVKISNGGNLVGSTITGSGSTVSHVPTGGSRPGSSASKPSAKPEVKPEIPSGVQESGIFTYIVNEDKTATITGVTEEAREQINTEFLPISVPAELGGFKVIEIADGAFLSLSASELTLPEGLKRIGDAALSWMTRIDELTIPASVEEIGAGALAMAQSLGEITVAEGNTAYCSVDGVLFDKDQTALLQVPAGYGAICYEIPDTVKNIRKNAFMGCTMNIVDIPESVINIHSGAFSMMYLTSVYIPASVQKIHEDAFRYTNIDKFEIDPNNERYCAVNNAWYDKEMYELYWVAVLNDTTFVIPDTVQKIGAGAFFDLYNLERLVIPSTVSSIDENAFYNTNPILVVEENSVADRYAKKYGFTIEYMGEDPSGNTPTASGSALSFRKN